MKSAKLTKRVRFAKVGDEIIVPLGMIFPHCVKLTKVYTDIDGQIVGMGNIIFKDGCSTWHIGQEVGICLGWK